MAYKPSDQEVLEAHAGPGFPVYDPATCEELCRRGLLKEILSASTDYGLNVILPRRFKITQKGIDYLEEGKV